MVSKKNNKEHIEPEETKEEVTESKEPITEPEEEVATSKPEEPEQEPVEFEEKQGKRGVKLGTIAIILALIFGGGLTYLIQQKSHQHEQQIAQLKAQLTSTQTNLSQEMESTKSEVVAQSRDIYNRTQVELEQQQKSIESLQLALADVKGRRPNDWLLAESDYLVKLAGRKLFLEHDIVSATTLMENADQRIAALNDPSLVPLRRALANDITLLRSLPLIDRDGLILALTSLQLQVDELPLANAILPEAPVVETKEVSEDINDWQQNLQTSLKEFSEHFITFRTRDGNVIPLLSPEQHFYLRENIKAKIETAMKGVYTEQGEIFSTSLKVAHEWSTQFFNLDNPAVQRFNQRLETLGKQNIQVNYPVKLETQELLSDVIADRLRREMTTIITEETK
ncbi:putative Uroporphyrinogen III methylase HemX [Vibrio nigripulchritudo SO65]|uniref:uroporphyrinogen-III C-methyltransferase n=1 Tax=Vibrio nigripulchritudo TaxID=28173 RepID=UPI0003B1BC67|nr:uroporphyrinogen-III C-methyltransferase [Vibrio nigripulchritudo]CCN35274.1 putative Uroporphyrinogen III methylase HemX [Vibrio nigripulchritudo AM115]CCN42749.1 putative Uroporphyrinogen III methylase HemX [Vibrio nigripulchritudo FTn2]CCN78901.1 putative Uroporphyrinogen III methylase HemX [Vibrio nigripulchritudo SO65]